MLSSVLAPKVKGQGQYAQFYLTYIRSAATTKSTARPSCVVGVLYDISQE